MRLADLPTDLQDLVCGYCWDATVKQTKRSLCHALVFKDASLHPSVRMHTVRDYTYVKNRWTYNRDTMSPGILAPFRTAFMRYSTSPLESFFVWFSFCELWNIPLITEFLYDLDWRKCGFIRRETGFRARHDLLMWICSSLQGLYYYSDLLYRVKSRLLKKKPAPFTDSIARSNAIGLDLLI